MWWYHVKCKKVEWNIEGARGHEKEGLSTKAAKSSCRLVWDWMIYGLRNSNKRRVGQILYSSWFLGINGTF